MTWLGLTADQWIEAIGFLITAAASLVSALGVMFAPRVLHAAVWLLFCLLSIAGLYALMAAHVVFAIQILVYAGAIAVLIIFTVVLLERGPRGQILAGSQHLFAGVIGAGFVCLVLVLGEGYVCWQRGFPATPVASASTTNVAAIGQLFLTRDLLSFELISVVLLVAMIGAIVIARADRRAKDIVEEAAKPTEEGEEPEWTPPLSAGKEVEQP